MRPPIVTVLPQRKGGRIGDKTILSFFIHLFTLTAVAIAFVTVGGFMPS
ncbi:MAG: hypothetical protein AAF590_07790 [Pseudomonadota bacterium]